jgi:hypothetical protein
VQCWNREDGERRRNYRRERRQCWNNEGGVRRRQCTAEAEKMEKGGVIIAEGEDGAGTIKVE